MTKSRTAPAKKDAHDPVTRDMPVADIVALCPEAEPLLAEYGLHCFRCEGSAYENLADGCATHGFTAEDIDDLVSDLNDLIARMPVRPETLTVTAPAARAIKGIAQSEGKSGEGLAVIADGRGGFCMEFKPDPAPGERTFFNREEPDVRIFASTLTLKRIGGAAIDFREERFKLDLPEDSAEKCGCRENSCGCGGAAARTS